MSAADPLLSVEDVARLWMCDVSLVLRYVDEGRLTSLSRGALSELELLKVPTIRRSWVDAVQQDGPGATRRLGGYEGAVDRHPALGPAFAFHSALDTGDAEGVWQNSSSRSRGGLEHSELLEIWREVAGHCVGAESIGIGTAIYDLSPYDAVAARLIRGALAIPRPFVKPTPAELVDILPLINESDGWRVDLPYFRQRKDLIPLLDEPLPPGHSKQNQKRPVGPESG